MSHYGIQPHRIQSPRDLRAWHWAMLAEARMMEAACRVGKMPKAIAHYQLMGDFHLSCVVALNECEDCKNTTAEQDCAGDEIIRGFWERARESNENADNARRS